MRRIKKMKEMCSKNGVKLISQNFETYVEVPDFLSHLNSIFDADCEIITHHVEI